MFSATKNHKNVAIGYFVLVLVSIVVFLSSPGWNGGFWLDDGPNILDNSAIKIQSLDFLSLYNASAPTAGMTRPVSYVSFAINYFFGGMEPYYFKLTNTIIHSTNAVLFFFLSIRLIQLIKESIRIPENNILWLAFAISLFWAVTPMNVTNSLYVVQRMNELSSMFIAIGCLLYLHIRTTDNKTFLNQIIYLVAFLFVLLLAALSKENGVLLVPLCLCLEMVLRAENKNSVSNHLFFKMFFVLLFILPLIYILYHYFNHIVNITQTSISQNFSPLERLLTQFRIVIIYAKQTFFPDIYQLTFLHDGYDKSISLFEPVTTFLSLLFWSALSIFALYFRKIAPWLIFGLVWFYVAHSIESSILPLELMYEHRNYTPSYGLIFAVLISIYFLFTSPFRLRAPTFGKKGGLRGFTLLTYNPLSPPSEEGGGERKNYIFVFFAIYILILAMNTWFVTNIWGNHIFMYKTFVDNNPNSARAHLFWGDINARLSIKHPENKEYYDEAIKSGIAITTLNKNMIVGITMTILLKNVLQINFDKDTEQLYHRLRIINPSKSLIVNTEYFVKYGLLGPTKLPTEIIENHFKILFNNPKITGMYKGILYKKYATFLYLEKGMSQEVLDYLKKGIEHYPEDMISKINYIEALINARQYKNAEEFLELLTQMDKFGHYSPRLNKFKALLNSEIQNKTNMDLNPYLPTKNEK